MSFQQITILDYQGAKQTVNTTPNAGQATSGNSLPVVPSTTGIVQWNGTVYDMTNYSTVAINCMVAPTTAWTITADDGINSAITVSAVANNSTGIFTTTTISAVGRYTIPGNCRVTLSGGSGGTFSIVGFN